MPSSNAISGALVKCFAHRVGECTIIDEGMKHAFGVFGINKRHGLDEGLVGCLGGLGVYRIKVNDVNCSYKRSIGHDISGSICAFRSTAPGHCSSMSESP